MNSQPNKPRAVRRPTPDSKRNAANKKDTDRPQSAPPASRKKTNHGPSDLKNSLRSQTPLNRRMQQKRSAPADPGTIRRTSKPQYYRIKDDEPVKRGVPVFFKRAFLVLICYAVLMPVSVLLFALSLSQHSTPETNDYIYQVGPDKGYYSRKVLPWSVVRSGSDYYLNMTELAAYCGLTTTGDDSAIRYVVKETGETVEFVLDQSVAYVNGIQERTGANAYMKNGNVYVPLDFVDRCFSGIDTSVDLEKSKITVLRKTDSDGNPMTLSFPYKPAAATDAIRFADLPYDLQMQILIQNQPQAPEESPTEPAPDGNGA